VASFGSSQAHHRGSQILNHHYRKFSVSNRPRAKSQRKIPLRRHSSWDAIQVMERDIIKTRADARSVNLEEVELSLDEETHGIPRNRIVTSPKVVQPRMPSTSTIN
jgi:hypothetical protein